MNAMELKSRFPKMGLTDDQAADLAVADTVYATALAMLRSGSPQVSADTLGHAAAALVIHAASLATLRAVAAQNGHAGRNAP